MAIGCGLRSEACPDAPPAPGRLSTRTGLPSRWAKPFASRRACTSAPPPGEAGTMIVTALVGYSIADTGTAAHAVRIAQAART